ncbi:MAG TPA: BatA domain-containing protein [Vicinamibacterales bacterium]
MNFLFPAFLLGALAVAIPIALHFFRRDAAPEVPFTAVRLLQRSPLERSRRRRLRDILLLAARVAALLLLAIAFARPYLAGAAGSAAGLRIVAIDRSFSMAGRFDHALELARKAIDEAGRGERIAVIAFDDRADVLAPPGLPSDARASLNGLRAGFGGTRYAPVLERAADLADGEVARLVIVSDLQRSGWEDERRPAVPASLALDVRDAGAATRNAAVTAVRVEDGRLVATISNAGAASTGQLTVVRDGQRVAGAPYSVGADSSVEVPIVYRAPQTGSIAVAIDDRDGFAADDTRHVLLDRASRPGVLIVTSSGAPDSAFYLGRALAAAAPGSPDDALVTRTVSGAGFSAMTDEELARYSAVVLLSTRGLDRRGRDSLHALVQRGGGLLVAAGDEVEAPVLSTTFDWKPALSNADRTEGGVTLVATDLRHPIFRPFGPLTANLGQVRFERAWRVKPDGWDVAARFTDGTPALLERRSGEGHIILFASDIDRRWNDFPLNPAFVPFAVEAVRYAAGTHDQTADYVVSRVPRGTPAEPGIYRVKPGDRPIAVNVDPRESGVARLAPEEFAAMVDRIDVPARSAEVRAQQAETSQGYWRYGLMLMIAALVAESVVGRV